ncbi:MAG: hypothetical protein AAGE03_10345 [Pseudomonadota bacterium]
MAIDPNISARCLLVGAAICVSCSIEAFAQVDLPLPTDAQQRVIGATIDICFSPPNEIFEARQALTNLGWQSVGPSVSGNEAPPHLEALFGVALGSQFDTNDIRASVADASFRAASALGNSSLGPDQIGLIYAGTVLGMIGVEEAVPYCVMSGPGWLFRAIDEASLDLQMSQSSSLMLQGMGIDRRGAHQVVVLVDPDAIVKAVLEANEPPQSAPEDFTEEAALRSFFNPVSVAIYPNGTLRELYDR